MAWELWSSSSLQSVLTLRIDSLEKLKTFLPVMDAYVSDLCSETTFFELYHWAFLYIKDDDDKKSVDIDVLSPSLLYRWRNRTQSRSWMSCLNLEGVSKLVLLPNSLQKQNPWNPWIKINGIFSTSFLKRIGKILAIMMPMEHGQICLTNMLNGVEQESKLTQVRLEVNCLEITESHFVRQVFYGSLCGVENGVFGGIGFFTIGVSQFIALG